MFTHARPVTWDIGFANTNVKRSIPTIRPWS